MNHSNENDVVWFSINRIVINVSYGVYRNKWIIGKIRFLFYDYYQPRKNRAFMAAKKTTKSEVDSNKLMGSR